MERNRVTKHKQFPDDTLWDKIQSKYWDIVPYNYRPSQLWYRLKCKVWHRYATVKPRYLPQTWCDRDDLLSHTMFEILSDFIEMECSPGNREWYGEYGHKITVDEDEVFVRDEMQDLYDWWHLLEKEKDNLHDILWGQVKKIKQKPNVDSLSWGPKFNNEEDKQRYKKLLMEMNDIDRLYEEELQERLIRLIRIKPYMWT